MYSTVGVFPYKDSLFLTDCSPTTPKITADSHKEEATKGSNVNLTCRGRRVDSFDTSVFWMFNSQEIPENSNKKTIDEFLAGRKGIFSLVITNVSEKDFGNYSCHAKVRDDDHTLSDEDFIELSLYKKGEFHCCSDFYKTLITMSL